MNETIQLAKAEGEKVKHWITIKAKIDVSGEHCGLTCPFSRWDHAVMGGVCALEPGVLLKAHPPCLLRCQTCIDAVKAEKEKKDGINKN